MVYINSTRFLINIRGIPPAEVDSVLRGISNHFNVAVVIIRKKDPYSVDLGDARRGDPDSI